VNGRRISGSEILSPGDKIQVGATTLVVQVSVPSAAEPAAEPPAPEAAAPDADTRSSAQRPMPEPPTAEPEPPTAGAQPPLSLQLDFDPATAELTIRLGEDSDEVRFIYENGRWRLAPDA
jgi:pyruvate/2-oxoglutarate dehydrogenase complex dihydrolipoamide acyltransferase (E2) component